MTGYKAAAYAVLLSTALDISACRSKHGVPPVETKPANNVSSTKPESPDEKSCHAFVQKFYDWQISQLIGMFCQHALKGSNASQEAIDSEEEQCRVASAYRSAAKLNLHRVLSPELQRYLNQEEAIQAKEEDAGLDFDPFLNTQDPSPQFIVDRVHVSGNRCDAVVHGYDSGKQREEVMPELSRSSGRWVIVNFHYKVDLGDGKPPFDDDLIHMLREYIGPMPPAAR